MSALSKLNSDRLWAMLAFLCLIVANAAFGLGLEVVGDGADYSPLTMAGITVATFILGKSVRGTGAENVIATAVSTLSGAAGKAIEALPDDADEGHSSK